MSSLDLGPGLGIPGVPPDSAFQPQQLQGPPPQLQGAGLPPGLAAALQGPPPPAQGSDPLAALQDAIHAVAAAMASLPDPQDTQDAAQALLGLSKIQTRLMGQQSAAPQS